MNSVEKSPIESHEPRYDRIDELNAESFFMMEGSDLEVIQSLYSAGAPRDVLTPSLADAFDKNVVEKAQAIGRRLLAGNMSAMGYGPKELSPEDRIKDAKANVEAFLEQYDIDPADVRILFPDREYTTPLNVINLDEESLSTEETGLLRPDDRSDMLYTFNPELILAARPADCPIVFITAETPKGQVTALLHLAWLGVAHGYVPQAKVALDALGVDWKSVRVQVTPGGHGETYTYTNNSYNPHERFPNAAGMFINLQESTNDKGEPAYNFGIDVAAESYEQIVREWGIDAYQMYMDTSNTTSPAAGYSSHSRTFKEYAVDGDNSRDIVLARWPHHPKQNPENEAPLEILKSITPVRVGYIDFEGKAQAGTIEMHQDLVEDVKQFFELAKDLKFPIERVVKSSDSKYSWDDDTLMADNATTGYNYRLIKGTDRPSLHAEGRALDVNDALNPFIRYEDGKIYTDPEGAVYDPSRPGTLTAEHPLVQFMKKRGWEWGGDWTAESGRIDYQHFQKPATQR